MVLSGPSRASEGASTLKVALFDGCPFICPDETGPFVDGLKAAFEGSRYQLEFRHVPFARAVKELQSGHLDLLPGILKDSIDGALFPENWLYFTRMCFYSRADDAWRWDGLKSLGNRLIAVEKGIVHTPAFFDHVQANPRVVHLSGDDILLRQLQILGLGRIDSFTAERTVLAHHLEQKGIKSASVINSGCFDPEFEFVAVSSRHPEAATIVDVLNRGLADHNRTIAPEVR